VLFGTKVDDKATVLFLPSELEQNLDITTYNGKPLVKNRQLLLAAKPLPVPFSIWNNIYTYLLFLALVVLLNKKWLTLFYLILIGLLGIFFSLNGFYSLHEELAMNYNVLLFNPLLLIVAFFYLRSNMRGMYFSSIACIVLVAAYVIVVFNKAHFLVVLPMIVANLVILVRLALRSQSGKIA
jgi:hypothetical protein